MPPHLLLVNLGTPTAPQPDAVRAFLLEFLSDRDVVDLPGWLWQPILRSLVLRRRPERVAKLYESIWTPAGSPLRAETERMVHALRESAGGRFTVSAAYRYGQPSISNALAEAARETDGEIIVVPLFPHRTCSTTRTVITEAHRCAAAFGIAHRVRTRTIPPDAPGYVTAMAARWGEALDGYEDFPEHIVLSYHGIPLRYDLRERRQYSRDCAATTRAFLQAINWPAEHASMTFQSKFGPEPWLTPSTAGTIERLPARGIHRVAVITPGFLTEGLETLEEIGIQGRESFEEAGGTSYLRVGAVEAHPAMLDVLAGLTEPSTAP